MWPSKSLNLTIVSVTLRAGARTAPATRAAEANVMRSRDNVSEGWSMRTSENRPSRASRRGIASKGQLALAGILLLGVIVMGYGYFQQNEIGFYIGLVVVVAGVLNGVVQIVLRGNG